MDLKTIIKNNQRINEFMGVKTDKVISYHQDWLALMECVNKIFVFIENKEYQDIKPNVTSIDFIIEPFYIGWIAWDKRRSGDLNMDNFESITTFSLQERIWETIVTFLEWLNNNKL